MSRIRCVQGKESSQCNMMAHAVAVLAGSASSSHWWNTDIEVEAVMQTVRFQSEYAGIGLRLLRIPSGRMRGFSESHSDTTSAIVRGLAASSSMVTTLKV